ncbi:DDE Tnp4 domain-containing protein [Trichonephila clavipes]|nr:DDE Tnp4 domain-containing protein [Trichonephila clavipes]
MNLVPKMFSFFDNQAYFSAEDAKETRLVTLIHWLVEAVNAQLKSWRDLNSIIPYIQIPYTGDYIKIVCAIIHAFHPARLNNIEDGNVIVQRMLDLVKMSYYLQRTVEENGWQGEELYEHC